MLVIILFTVYHISAEITTVRVIKKECPLPDVSGVVLRDARLIIDTLVYLCKLPLKYTNFVLG